MPRGRSIPKHKITPDPIYGDPRITKFINYVMLDGKKNTAQKVVYAALEKASEKLKVPAIEIFEKSMEAIRPEVEVRSRRVGGANYQIPVPVARTRGDFLAMGWMIEASRKRSGKPMAAKLAEELINAYKGEGDAVKKRENTHKMAEANKAFAHFRW